MTLLTGVTDLANRVRDEIQSNLGRYQNKKFRDACMGVSALVAMADGILQDEERKKVIACIRNTEALSFFDATELRDIFLGFVIRLKMNSLVWKSSRLLPKSKAILK